MKENTKDYLFSIIIPVYNTEKYVQKCLNSVKNAMDYKDCEVIIVNDGSTDKSEEKINEFLKTIPEEHKDNFVYIKKKNKGLADTKNVGIEHSRGKFISVVDSDDYISDDFYTIARKYVDKYDMIIYDVYVVFEKNPKSNYTSRAYRDWIEEEKASYINGAISGSSCNKIIRKDLYKGHRFPVGKQYEDTAVTPLIIEEAKKIKYVPYPMYYYLQREKSIVAGNTFATAFYKICENISEVLKDKKLDDYKFVISEFFTSRILDIFDQDLKEDKENFIEHIKKFKKTNNRIIDYIIKTDLVNKNYEQNYSERQIDLVNKIFNYLKDENYSKIKNMLIERRIINKLRKIKK